MEISTKAIRKKDAATLLFLSARCLLAFVFCSYGYDKLFGNQFGQLTAQELSTPVKDLSLFKVSWFIFENEPFKTFIGISQIVAGTLLLFNRTHLVGAFMLIPIILNILVIDLTIMPYHFKVSFTFRLSFYLLLTFLILYRSKEQVIAALAYLAPKAGGRRKIPLWYYLLIPIIGILLELVSWAIKITYNFITDPSGTAEAFRNSF